MTRDEIIAAAKSIPEFVWEEGCGYESGVVEQQVIEFATLIRNQTLEEAAVKISGPDYYEEDCTCMSCNAVKFSVEQIRSMRPNV